MRNEDWYAHKDLLQLHSTFRGRIDRFTGAYHQIVLGLIARYGTGAERVESSLLIQEAAVELEEKLSPSEGARDPEYRERLLFLMATAIVEDVRRGRSRH